MPSTTLRIQRLTVATRRAHTSTAERDRLLAQLVEYNDKLLETNSRLAAVEKDKTAIEILLTSNESNKVLLEGQLSDALKDIQDLKEYSKRLNDENCNLLYLKSKEHVVNSSLQVAIQNQSDYESTVKQLTKQLETSQKRLAEASADSQTILDKFMVKVELEKQQMLAECNRDWESKLNSRVGHFEGLLQQAGSSVDTQAQTYKSQAIALEAEVSFLRGELLSGSKEVSSLRAELQRTTASAEAARRDQHDDTVVRQKDLTAAKQRGDKAEARLRQLEQQKGKELEEKSRQMTEIGERGRQLSLELGDEVRKNQAKEVKYKKRIAELSERIDELTSGASAQQSLQQHGLLERIAKLSDELEDERRKKAAAQEVLARELDSKQLEEKDFRALSEALEKAYEKDSFADELTKKLGMMMVNKYELLEARMVEQQREVERLLAANRQLEREAESHRARVSPEKVAAKDSELKGRLREIEAKDEEIRALKASLAAAVMASTDGSSKLSALETKYGIQTRLLDELKQSGNMRQAQETQALAAKNCELQSKHEEYRFEAGNKLSKMEAQVLALEAELKRQVSAASIDKDLSREELLVGELTRLEQRAAAAERDLEACRTALHSSEDSGRALALKVSQAEELRNELKEQRRRCVSSEEELATAKQQLQELGEEMMREALSTTQRKSDIQQLSSELESLKSVYKPLLSEFESLSNELQAKTIALDTESNFRQVAERNLERLKSNLGPISSASSAAAASPLIVAAETARKAAEAAEERVSALEETNALLEQTCHEREERYSEALRRQTELEVELSQSSGLINSAREHIQHLEDLLKRASSHIASQVAAAAEKAERAGTAGGATDASAEVSTADSAAAMRFDEMITSTLSSITQAVGMVLPLDVLGSDSSQLAGLSEELKKEPTDLPAALQQLNKLRRSYATLLDVSSALKADARAAEDEYKSAARQLIETVETQRMSLMKEIEDQRRRLQVSKNKISLYKTMIRSQKVKIEHLARRFNLDISDPDVKAGSMISGVTDMTDADF